MRFTPQSVTKAIVIVLITLAVVAGTVFGLMNYSLRKEETDHGVSGVRYLRSVIQTYSKDARKDGRMILFPDSLETLVKENYLNRGDLDDFYGLTIEVFQPKGEGIPTDVILRARSRHKLFVCPLEGEIQVKNLQ